MKDNLYLSIIGRVLVFDVVLVMVTTASWIYVSEVSDRLFIAGLWLLVHGLRVGLWLADLRLKLAPVQAWRSESEQTSDAVLLAADVVLSRLPARASIHYAIGWSLAIIAIPSLAWLGLVDAVTMGRNELFATLPAVLACVVGLPTLVHPLLQLRIDSTRLELGAECERRELERRADMASLNQRMAITTIGLALGPMLVLLSVGWVRDSQTNRARALESGRYAVTLALDELELGAGPGEGITRVDADDLPEPLARQLAHQLAPGAKLEAVDLRRERVYVAAPTVDGSFVVTERGSRLRLQLSVLLPILALIVGWAVQASAILARTIMIPLDRLRDASKRIVEVGDLREMGIIPAARADELGELTHNFNMLVTTFEQLADAAAKVANGDLSIEITSQGDLPDAFAAMIDQLHDVVANIRRTALELATASSEIQAATQEQEAASVSQDAAMVALGEIMRELTESSTQVSEAAAHVLANAEGTLRTTDETSGEIAKLRQDIQGIDELLGLINEIADRSDLLALNGSLEATRAGEAGRGFALVAAEMRRLAERVTGTVADVREQVVNIQRSSASTVTATTRSHGLAEETAKAARDIVDETDRQQRSAGQASYSVRDVAEVIGQVKSATTQTRSTAEGLREQAMVLERLVAPFKLRED